MNGDSKAPSSKVVAGTVFGGLGVALVWGWNNFMPETPMSAEVGAAFAVLVGSVAAYFKREMRLWREAVAGEE